jgi:hypothetical protein
MNGVWPYFEVQLRELSEALMHVPKQRPSSAGGKVGGLREEVAATGGRPSQGGFKGDMSDTEMAGASTRPLLNPT